MRYYIHNILIILLSAFGKACVQKPQAVLLRGRKITALFGVLVSHIRAAFFAHKCAKTRPEPIAAHRTMRSPGLLPRWRSGRASFTSRVSPEIFAVVCGKVSVFLGFPTILINRLICTPLQGRANLSHNRACPERMPMVGIIASAHAR